MGGKVTGREKDERASLARRASGAGGIEKMGGISKERRGRKTGGEKERKTTEDEGTLDYKLSGDDSIAYRPLGSPEEVFHVLLRYTILYEERSYEGVQVTNTPQLCQLELVVVQLF